MTGMDTVLAGWCSLSVGVWAAGGASKSGPSWSLWRRPFLFGFIGWWPARPSHGVSFADGGLATTR